MAQHLPLMASSKWGPHALACSRGGVIVIGRGHVSLLAGCRSLDKQIRSYLVSHCLTGCPSHHRHRRDFSAMLTFLVSDCSCPFLSGGWLPASFHEKLASEAVRGWWLGCLELHINVSKHPTDFLLTPQALMLDSVVKALGFVGEATRTNLFGLGCPIYCTQPSIASLLLCLLLGFLSGICITCYTLWTFCSFGFPPSGSAQPSPASRYSVLAEYLDEHGSRTRRRHPWAHLQLGGFVYFHPWTSRSSLWPAPIHHPSWHFLCGIFPRLNCLLLCGWKWAYSHYFCSSSCWPSNSWSDPGQFWSLPSGVVGFCPCSQRASFIWFQGQTGLDSWTVGSCSPTGSCIDPKQDPAYWPQASCLRCGLLLWVGFAHYLQLQCFLLEGHWRWPFPIRLHQPGVP